MTIYLLKRLLIGIATLIVASLVVFLMLEVVPGDPARLMLGMNASDAQVDLLRSRWG
jgi:peptide/nickel transport system permease protein